MKLCCIVNPYTICICNMQFCSQCLGDTSRDSSLGGGHIVQVNSAWDGRGRCTVTGKIVICSPKQKNTDPWRLI